MTAIFESLGEYLVRAWDQFSMPTGTALKKLIEDFIPFYDILYGWATSILARDTSIIYSKIVFPKDDIIEFCIACMVYVLLTEVLDKLQLFTKMKKSIRFLCATVAVATVNTILNQFASEVVENGGNEVFVSFLNNTGKSILITVLLIGLIIIFITKLKSGIALSKLIINSCLMISKKIIELAIMFLSAVFVMVIYEILISNLSDDIKIWNFIIATICLIALTIILWLIDKIYEIAER